MILRLRVILDSKEDVLRDIEIEEVATLEDLHNSIIKAFGFLGNEMASFFYTDDNWLQGEELSLIELDSSSPTMNEEILKSIFTTDNHKLIYVYDFLILWTFYVELMEIGGVQQNSSYPKLIYSLGEVPEEAPEKSFESSSEDKDTSYDDQDINEKELDEDSFY
jgi:hypothetical protein